MKTTFGSLFSGIGGFDLGFERSGMECLWQVEADKSCQNVLRKHWEGCDLYDDVRKVGKHNLKSVDVICGGFPCQDVSTAGKRAGFEGERSSLWFEFDRIIKELLPKWVVIENVPGLLSSNNGNDFETVIRALDELGYGVSWRILDSQNFGVAQRRRRVFIVASLGNLCSAEVLFDTEGVSGDYSESRENGEEASGSSLQSDFGNSQQEVEYVTMASAQAHAEVSYDKSPTLTILHEQPIVMAFQRSQLRTNKMVNMLDKAPTLKAYTKSGDTETTVWQMNHASEVYREGSNIDISPTLQARMGTGGNNVPLVGLRRLTPVECARLQGFPDFWNAYGADGDKISDTNRYKQFGNAVTVNVAEWIGKRIGKIVKNTLTNSG